MVMGLGYSDIFTCFGVQNIEFQHFLVFQKSDYFWGMKILWIYKRLDYIGGHFYVL